MMDRIIWCVKGVLKICMVRLVVKKINGKVKVFYVVWKLKIDIGNCIR